MNRGHRSLAKTLAWTWSILTCTTVAIAEFSSGAKESKTLAEVRTPAGGETPNPFLSEPLQDPGWPQLRGPNYDGRSPEIHLADSWPPQGPPVLWARSLGQGYSGFAAVGNRVYTQMQTLSGQYVVCLDADTGATRWEYRAGWPYEPGGIYPGPRATPTYDSGRIYFAAPQGLIGCLNAENGGLIWSVNVAEKFGGRGTEFGYSCSPTVEEGLVILPVGGKGASVVALDAKTGATVWQSGDDPASYTPAFPITWGGQRQIVVFLQNALAGLELQTGRQLWRKNLSQGYDEHAAWPIYSEPYLMISVPFKGGAQLIELPDRPEATLRTIWQSRLMSNDIFSSILLDGYIYGFDLRDIQAKAHRASRGTFRCLNFLTGKEQWSTDRTGHCTVIEANGKLILFNDTGQLILARASPDDYEELARAQVLGGEICWTQPTLHRGRIFVRNQSEAACVFIGESALLERDLPLGPGHVTLIGNADRWDLVKLLGVEKEYPFDVPSPLSLCVWYEFSLVGMLGLAAMFTAVAGLAVGKWANSLSVRLIYWVSTFLLGAVGTPTLSLRRSEFVFLWPLCLFAAFQAVVYWMECSKRHSGQRRGKWLSWVAITVFVLLCLGYYLLCRRLSLATELAFLAGFPAALPFAAAAARCSVAGGWRMALEPFWMALAFSAYFWSSVLLMMWKNQMLQ